MLSGISDLNLLLHNIECPFHGIDNFSVVASRIASGDLETSQWQRSALVKKSQARFVVCATMEMIMRGRVRAMTFSHVEAFLSCHNKVASKCIWPEQRQSGYA
jgi:S-adenosylmethionine hydrolase